MHVGAQEHCPSLLMLLLTGLLGGELSQVGPHSQVCHVQVHHSGGQQPKLRPVRGAGMGMGSGCELILLF